MNVTIFVKPQKGAHNLTWIAIFNASPLVRNWYLIIIITIINSRIQILFQTDPSEYRTDFILMDAQQTLKEEASTAIKTMPLFKGSHIPIKRKNNNTGKPTRRQRLRSSMDGT